MKHQLTPVISIVVPCYNEAETIIHFLSRIKPILYRLDKTFEIVFVNDGSVDGTLEVMLEAQKNCDSIRVLNLSRNFGKEAALSAGLEHIRGHVAIPMDVDLQDPPELIESFVEKWEQGYEVVIAKRVDRASDSMAKRVSAKAFYRVYNFISDIPMPDNVGDYRLMSSKVVEVLKKLPENQRFMKGLFAWAGFKTAVVEYTRESRITGESNFNGWKLWNLALDGITSFSTVPLKIWLYIGFGISFFSFIYGSFILNFRTKKHPLLYLKHPNHRT